LSLNSQGDLQYFAVAHPYTDFILPERRSVYEQELNVPASLKQNCLITSILLASGDSHYTYKFIDKNCTSMVVDIINKTLDTTAIVKNTDTNITYRTILYPYFDGHFYEKLELALFWKSRSIRKHFFTFRTEQKFKDYCTIQSAAWKENKLLAFGSSKLLVEQLL
jgi:hypothetical protein